MKLTKLRKSVVSRGGKLAHMCMCTLFPLVGLASTYYVDNKLDDYTGHDGSSWALAYHRIQDAVASYSIEPVYASGMTLIVR